MNNTAKRKLKLARRAKVLANQQSPVKRPQLSKRERGIVTKKMDRHWKCGCVIRHIEGHTWEQVVVCPTHSIKAPPVATKTISAEEVNKKLAEQAK